MGLDVENRVKDTWSESYDRVGQSSNFQAYSKE